MALIVSERDALLVVAAEIRNRNGNGAGMNTWTRNVLGAHGEQAAQLVADANLYLQGSLDLDVTYPEPRPDANLTVTRTIEGRDLSIDLKADRLPITSYEQLVEFYEIDTTRWHPTKQSFNFWGNEDRPNFSVKAEFREVEYRGLTDEDRQAVRDWYALLAPAWEPAEFLATPNDQLLEIVVSDLHADQATISGTTVEDHLERVRSGVRRILERAAVDGLERIALVFLGDTFNHDGAGATSNGTPQDSHGPPRSVYRQVRDFIGELAQSCSVVAPVDLYILSGNHDDERAFHAADSLHGLLSGNRRITVHTDTRRNAIEWGINLIGLWHGDRQKNPDIAMTLMREFDTRGKRVFEVHLGHEHTRKEDEIHGVLLRRFRTPTPPSDWSDRNLYGHNQKSITGILWHRDLGEIATYPVTFFGGEE
jgi:hypothetical protein